MPRGSPNRSMSHAGRDLLDDRRRRRQGEQAGVLVPGARQPVRRERRRDTATDDEAEVARAGRRDQPGIDVARQAVDDGLGRLTVIGHRSTERGSQRGQVHGPARPVDRGGPPGSRSPGRRRGGGVDRVRCRSSGVPLSGSVHRRRRPVRRLVGPIDWADPGRPTWRSGGSLGPALRRDRHRWRPQRPDQRRLPGPGRDEDARPRTAPRPGRRRRHRGAVPGLPVLGLLATS